MDSKTLKKMLLDDGWYEVRANSGSHLQYKHPIKKGKVTLPHPKKDLPPKTLKSILKQAGLVN